ncbi:hypothetical protein [Stutzerimonas xanthomarina]|uniref:hypothetical protein n=1 Tax=Stutzerimonas xanthomarina TaxID=271420 RepID=UPI003AA7D3F4
MSKEVVRYLVKVGRDLKEMVFASDYEALLAERDAAQKDAERYRWLREQEAEDGMAILPIGKWVKPAMLVTTPFDSPEMVDSVIDAALQGEQP